MRTRKKALLALALLAAAPVLVAAAGYVSYFGSSLVISLYDWKILPAWAASTVYAVNTAVIGPDGLTIYKQNTGPSCTSGATGPTGYNAAIADGTCSWTTQGLIYVQNNSIDLVNRYGHISLATNAMAVSGSDGGTVTLSESSGLTFSAGGTAITSAKVTTPALKITSLVNQTALGTDSLGNLIAGTAVTPPASAGYLSTNAQGAYVSNAFSSDFLLTGTSLGLNIPAGEFPYRPATGNLTYAAFVPRSAWPTAPSLTAGTPGDLVPNCSTATGNYSRTGTRVRVDFTVTCAPTYTTASGTLQITNLPFTAATGTNFPLIATSPMSASGVTSSLAITAITSGSTFTFSGAGEYDTSSAQ